MESALPVIAVTAGDPAGIGPELAVRAAADSRFAGRVKFRLYGEPSILAEAAKRWSGGRSAGGPFRRKPPLFGAGDRRGFGALRQTRL